MTFLQAFFCGRSDYFKALLLDHFGESDDEGPQRSELAVFPLHDVSTDVFMQVMYYIYQDRCLQVNTLCEFLPYNVKL